MKKRCFVIFFLILMIALPAFAITAGDVLNRMSPKEQSSYITGSIDMAMYLAGTQGNPKQSECILNWYYNGDRKGVRDVIATFEKYKDQPAVALIKSLVVRQCGEFPKAQAQPPAKP